jgi:acyl carrier protein
MKHTGNTVDLHKELASLVDQTLNLGGRTATFVQATPLLGAVPELDSMGVVSLITALEERFDITIIDDEIDGAVFETFGTLLAFVGEKVGS